VFADTSPRSRPELISVPEETSRPKRGDKGTAGPAGLLNQAKRPHLTDQLTETRWLARLSSSWAKDHKRTRNQMGSGFKLFVVPISAPLQSKRMERRKGRKHIHTCLLSVKQPFYILVFGLVTKWRYNWSTGLNLGDFWTIFRA
jgi:hypothetical protein